MFGDLNKLESFKIGRAEIRTTDALAVGLVAWGGYRWWAAKERRTTAGSAERVNLLIPLENEAQQDMYKLIGVGVALIVLPRLLS